MFKMGGGGERKTENREYLSIKKVLDLDRAQSNLTLFDLGLSPEPA
jgi:hypothetical protein